MKHMVSNSKNCSPLVKETELGQASSNMYIRIETLRKFGAGR